MKTNVLNPVLDFINTLCNFIALNLVFLITCLPVITIGTALSSLYSVTLKEAKEEYGYLVRPYIKEFRKNLKAGTAAFAILFLLAAVLLFNLVFWISMETIPGTIIATLVGIGLIALFFTFTYTFPLIARFENTTKQTLKNALAMAMSNGKSTMALLLIDVLVVFFCIFLSPMKILMVLFGFAFIAYCHSFVLKQVFAPYEKEQDLSLN